MSNRSHLEPLQSSGLPTHQAGVREMKRQSSLPLTHQHWTDLRDIRQQQDVPIPDWQQTDRWTGSGEMKQHSDLPMADWQQTDRLTDPREMKQHSELPVQHWLRRAETAQEAGSGDDYPAVAPAAVQQVGSAACGVMHSLHWYFC